MKIYHRYLEKLGSLENKVYIVTGANSGLGYQTTLHLSFKKCKVIMACRNVEKAKFAKNKILQVNPEASLDIVQYDQGNFSSIDKFSKYIQENYPKVDGIVCNAGVYFPKANYRTVDDLELTIGTNYFGVYKLLSNLMPYLEKCQSKVVMVTSLTATLANKKVLLKDHHNLSRNKIYGYSKYCLSRLCNELSKRYPCVKFYLTHPGICQTNIISSDQTGLPNWFSKLGHFFLYIFVHHASKACLTNIKALTSEDRKKNYIKPRGLFAISGYPVCKKLPKYTNKSIIKQTEEFLNNK